VDVEEYTVALDLFRGDERRRYAAHVDQLDADVCRRRMLSHLPNVGLADLVDRHLRVLAEDDGTEVLQAPSPLVEAMCHDVVEGAFHLLLMPVICSGSPYSSSIGEGASTLRRSGSAL
jgi:hypothetical protein